MMRPEDKNSDTTQKAGKYNQEGNDTLDGSSTSLATDNTDCNFSTADLLLADTITRNSPDQTEELLANYRQLSLVLKGETDNKFELKGPSASHLFQLLRGNGPIRMTFVRTETKFGPNWSTDNLVERTACFKIEEGNKIKYLFVSFVDIVPVVLKILENEPTYPVSLSIDQSDRGYFSQPSPLPNMYR